MDGNTNMARSGKHNGMVTMKPWCLNLNRPWHSSSSEIKTQEGRHCLLPRATQHLPCQVLLQTLKDPLVITLQVSQQCQAHLPETHIPQNRQGLQPFAQQQKKKKKSQDFTSKDGTPLVEHHCDLPHTAAMGQMTGLLLSTCPSLFSAPNAAVTLTCGQDLLF